MYAQIHTPMFNLSDSARAKYLLQTRADGKYKLRYFIAINKWRHLAFASTGFSAVSISFFGEPGSVSHFDGPLPWRINYGVVLVAREK
jgi:hypothetical protein